MQALVTGGAGFIGSHLVGALSAQGIKVKVLDDLSTGAESNVPPGAQLIIGDISDTAVVSEAVRGCQTVFHLAAVSSVQRSLEDPLDVHRANVTGTLVLLEAAAHAGVHRFVFSSSAAVYGDTGAQAASEDMTPSPMSHYAVQKLASEHYCKVYAQTAGIDTVCLRYFNVFGPRQRSDSPYSGVVARFLDAAHRSEPPVIYGDGGQTRDFCYVSDVVAANLAAARVPAENLGARVFNIGSGDAICVRELAGLILSQYPGGREPIYQSARAGEVRFSRADITQARKVIGYEPTMPFLTGLARLLKCEREIGRETLGLAHPA